MLFGAGNYPVLYNEPTKVEKYSVQEVGQDEISAYSNIVNSRYYLVNSSNKKNGAYFDISIYGGNNLWTADYITFSIAFGNDSTQKNNGTNIDTDSSCEFVVHAYFIYENNQRRLGEYIYTSNVNFYGTLESQNYYGNNDDHLYNNDLPKYRANNYTFNQSGSSSYFDSNWAYSAFISVSATYSYSSTEQYTSYSSFNMLIS